MIARRSAVGWSAGGSDLRPLVSFGMPPSCRRKPGRLFAPFDAGGMPSNLIELAPRAFSKGEILPTGSYVIWAAIKKAGTPYLTAAWKRTARILRPGANGMSPTMMVLSGGLVWGTLPMPNTRVSNRPRCKSISIIGIRRPFSSSSIRPRGGLQDPRRFSRPEADNTCESRVRLAEFFVERRDSERRVRGTAKGHPVFVPRPPTARNASRWPAWPSPASFRRTEEGQTVLYRISGELAPDLRSITRVVGVVRPRAERVRPEGLPGWTWCPTSTQETAV